METETDSTCIAGASKTKMKQQSYFVYEHSTLFAESLFLLKLDERCFLILGCPGVPSNCNRSTSNNYNFVFAWCASRSRAQRKPTFHLS